MQKYIDRYRSSVLLRNYTKIFSVDVLVKLSNFVLLPVYLRLMSQEQYGLYTYLFAIIGTFSLVLNFGLYIPQSKLYQDIRGELERGTLIYTLNVMLFFLLSISLGLTYLTGFDYAIINILFKNPVDYSSYRLLVCLAIIVTVYAYLLTNYFLTSQKIKYVQLYNLCRLISIHPIVLLLLYFLKGDAVKVRLQYTYLLELLLFVIFSTRYIKEMYRKFDKTIAEKAVKLALPVMLSAVLGIVLNFSDKFFLEKYGGFKDLAVYNLGITFAGIIPMMFITFQNIWLPHFFQEKDIEANQRKTKKVISTIAVFFIALSAGIIIVYYVLLATGIIQGDKYGPVLPLLPILLTTQIFIALTPLYSNYIIFFEKTYIALVIGIPLAVVSIFANLALVPQYGYYGAAISSLIVNGGYLLVYYLVVNSMIKKRIPEK